VIARAGSALLAALVVALSAAGHSLGSVSAVTVQLRPLPARVHLSVHYRLLPPAGLCPLTEPRADSLDFVRWWAASC
jgi:hypothetical protein